MKHTEETKQKLSIMRRGKKNPFYGKKHTERTKKILAEKSRTIDRRGQFAVSPTKIRIPGEESLAYIAGIIDGEGTIGIASPTKRRAQSPFLAIYNSNEQLMRCLVQEIGGAYHLGDRRGRVAGYYWRLSAARDVFRLCTALLPYLIIKLSDAKAILAFLDSKYGGKLHGD
jgi:hypothetical protein